MKRFLGLLGVLLPLLTSAQWMEKSSSTAGFYSLTVLNEDTLFVCDAYTGGLLHSVDGGVYWDTLHFPNAWNFKVQFLNDSVGFIGGKIPVL